MTADSNDDKLEAVIEKELGSLPNDFIVAVISSPEKYVAVNMAIANYLTNKRKMPGLYITMNKPYSSMVSALKKSGVDTSKLFFIDAISGVIGAKESGADNCVMLRSPSSLTELGIAISKVCSVEKARFLMMDSLSTLLVYNNQNSTVKFVHYVATRLRKCAWPGVIFSLEKDIQGSVLESISQFCDKIIRI